VCFGNFEGGISVGPRPARWRALDTDIMLLSLSLSLSLSKEGPLEVLMYVWFPLASFGLHLDYGGGSGTIVVMHAYVVGGVEVVCTLTSLDHHIYIHACTVDSYQCIHVASYVYVWVTFVANMMCIFLQGSKLNVYSTQCRVRAYSYYIYIYSTYIVGVEGLQLQIRFLCKASVCFWRLCASNLIWRFYNLDLDVQRDMLAMPWPRCSPQNCGCRN
jgi:hypothetical protein